MAGWGDDGHRRRAVRIGRDAGGHLDPDVERAVIADHEHLGSLRLVSARQVDARAGRRDDIGHEAVPVDTDHAVGQRDAALDRGIVGTTVPLRSRRQVDRDDRHGRRRLDGRRVEAPTRRVERRQADGTLLDRQPRAVTTDEADRPGGRQRTDRGSRVVEDLRRDEAPGDDCRERAVGSASGQRTDIREERSAAEGGGRLARGDRPARQSRSQVGQGANLELVRIGAVNEQPWGAADIDDAEESRAVDRLRGNRDAGLTAGWPREDGEAEPWGEHGESAARGAQGHRQRVVDDQA